MHPAERLSAQEKAVLDRLINKNSAIGIAQNLARGFRQLFGNKKPKQLETWFKAVRESGLDDLQTFALSLERERDALTAAMLLPWSNGPTEGIVTKLKLIKRSIMAAARLTYSENAFYSLLDQAAPRLILLVYSSGLLQHTLERCEPGY